MTRPRYVQQLTAVTVLGAGLAFSPRAVTQGYTHASRNAATTAATADSGLSDANIAAILDEANAADSSLAHLAYQKGTRADVRQFAQLMMGEHHALRAQGQALAKSLNLTPEPPAQDNLPAAAAAAMDSLQGLPKGTVWDKAYINHEVGYHEAVIQTATTALGAAKNAKLKALIQQAAPVLQSHLKHAQAIQAKLGS